jgi:hypothetical protein
MGPISDSFKGFLRIYYVGGYALVGRILAYSLIALGIIFLYFTAYGGVWFKLVDDFILIGVTMLVVDHFLEQWVKESLRKSLNRKLGEGRESQILWSVWKLKRYSDEYKWLFDGSLDGRDFSHGDLYRVNFGRDVDLRVSIRYADFIYANFGNAYLFNVDFSGSSFRNVQFQHAAMSWIKFRNCSFRGASFEGAKLHDTDFTGSDVTVSQLTRAKELRRVILPNGREIMGRMELYHLLTSSL